VRRTLAALWLSTAVLAAQTSFRTSVQYVTVDVVVTDKDDKPIGDLGIDDFDIAENGKSQKIADFQFVSIPAVSRDIAVNVAKQPDPDVATNTAPTPNSRLFVIVIDDLHLIEQDTVRIKRTLTDLVNVFSPDDEVAMVFVSHSNLGVNFTRNTSLIMARVDNIKAALGFGLDALAAGPQKDKDPDADLATSIALGPASLRGRDKSQQLIAPPSKFRLSYARSAVQTLSMVSHSLAGSNHGRRAVFFVTGGTTIDPFASSFDESLALDFRTLHDEYLKVFDDAKRADVPIYVIDPRGNAPLEETVRGDCLICSGPERTVLVNNVNVQHNNMAAIAVNTGGRAIFNASDMTRMMKEIVQENGSYYLLGYYPDPFTADGKFHELKVHVNRPGARVRARAGYEAPSATRASAPVADSVSAAIAAGVNVSGLALRAFAEPIASDGKTATVAVTVELTYPVVDGSKRLDDNIELRLVALDPDAKQKASSTRTHHFSAGAPPSASVSFLINDVITVPMEALTLRVAVGSQALGKAGTVQVPIEMPSESKGLMLGGIALGFDGSSHEPVLMPDAFAGLIPFQPTTTRTFVTTDVLRLFGHVYWKDKHATPAMTMTITGPNGPANSTPSLIVQKSAGDEQDAVVAAMLPMQGLAPGTYHLAISATLGGGKPVTRDVLFEVK
jgi:VWFA-related protein